MCADPRFAQCSEFVALRQSRGQTAAGKAITKEMLTDARKIREIVVTFDTFPALRVIIFLLRSPCPILLKKKRHFGQFVIINFQK